MAAIMGETGGSGRNPGLSGSAKNVIGPVNLAVILKQPPRFEIRADNGRFGRWPCLHPMPLQRYQGTREKDQTGAFLT